MTVSCVTNVDAVRRLQAMNLEFGGGPQELLEYEAEVLRNLVGRLAYIRAATLFLSNQTAERFAGSKRIDREFEGLGYIGVCSTQYNRRCGKYMLVMSLGDFWQLEFLRPQREVPSVLEQAQEAVTAAALRKGPLQVPILSLSEFKVEK